MMTGVTGPQGPSERIGDAGRVEQVADELGET